jgi:DNA-binding response OmpR family regulator
MNVLFLGKLILAHRLHTFLSKEGIQVVHLFDLTLAYRLINERKFDIVIVDVQLEKSANICNEISNNTNVPVMLMINEATTSWKSVCNVNTDGFLTEDSSNIELVARIKAVYRRQQSALQLTQLQAS